MNWPSPRDWSPRMAQSLKLAETIRKALPPEFIVKEGIHGRKAGEVYSFMTLVDGKVISKRAKILFFVKILGSVEDVSLGDNGGLQMGVLTVQLFSGDLHGFEHLKLPCPWRNP